ncbi:InlB B-repeat-containing protein [Faecalibacterium prausnitzii]|uniref:InlB B-repeat-containing protein n=1 Tax=Faecalibacterium prausnitzii TaxID=853 RepID=UPI003AAE1D22
MKKRIVSMILALSMVLSILPVSAFADAGAGFSSAAAEETNSITYSSEEEHEAVGKNSETNNQVVKIEVGTNGLPKAASGTGWSYDETTGLTITGTGSEDTEYILDGTVSCNVTVKNANSHTVYLLDGTVTGTLLIEADNMYGVRVLGGSYADVQLNLGTIDGGTYDKLTENGGNVRGGFFRDISGLSADTQQQAHQLLLPENCTLNGQKETKIYIIKKYNYSGNGNDLELVVESDTGCDVWAVASTGGSVMALPAGTQNYAFTYFDSTIATISISADGKTLSASFNMIPAQNGAPMKLVPMALGATELRFNNEGQPDLTDVTYVDSLDTDAKLHRVYMGNGWGYNCYPNDSSNESTLQILNQGGANFDFSALSDVPINCYVEITNANITGGEFGENGRLTITSGKISGGTFHNVSAGINSINGNSAVEITGGTFDSLFCNGSCSIANAVIQSCNFNTYGNNTYTISDTVLGELPDGIQKLLPAGQQLSTLVVRNGGVTAMNGRTLPLSTNTIYLVGAGSAELTLNTDVLSINDAPVENYNANTSADGKVLRITGKNDGAKIFVNKSTDPSDLKPLRITEKGLPDLTGVTGVPMSGEGMTANLYEGLGWKYATMEENGRTRAALYITTPDGNPVDLSSDTINPYHKAIAVEQITFANVTVTGIVAEGSVGAENTIIQDGTFQKDVYMDENSTIAGGTFQDVVRAYGKITGGSFIAEVQLNQNSEVTGGVFHDVQLPSYATEKTVIQNAVILGSLKTDSDSKAAISNTVSCGYIESRFLAAGQQQSKLMMTDGTVERLNDYAAATDAVYLIGNVKAEIRFSNAVTNINGEDVSAYNGAQLSADGKTLTLTAKNDGEPIVVNMATTGKLPFSSLSKSDFTVSGTIEHQTVKSSKDGVGKLSLVYVRTYDNEVFETYPAGADMYGLYKQRIVAQEGDKYTEGSLDIGEVVRRYQPKLDDFEYDPKTQTATYKGPMYFDDAPLYSIRYVPEDGSFPSVTKPTKAGTYSVDIVVDSSDHYVGNQYEVDTYTVSESKYTLTVDDKSTEHVAGEKLSFTADEKDGYTFTGWKVTGLPTDVDTTKATISFTMPANNVTLKAQYTENAPKTYKLDVTDAQVTLKDGSAVADLTAVSVGTELKATADEDTETSVFKSWSCTGLELTEEQSTARVVYFTMPDHDVNLKAEFVTPTNKLEVTDAKVTLKDGSDVADLTAVPVGTELKAIAYEDTETSVFKSWSCTGLELTEEQRTARVVYFTMPDHDVNLVAEFVTPTNKLEVTDAKVTLKDGGAVADLTAVPVGTELVATAPEKDGYTFTGWKVTGLSADVDTTKATISFTMPANNVTLKAQYTENAPKTYKLDVSDATITLKDGGAVADLKAVPMGTELKATADEDTETSVFKNWSCTGLELTEEQRTARVVYFTMPDHDVNLVAEFVTPTKPDPAPENYKLIVSYAKVTLKDGSAVADLTAVPVGTELKATADEDTETSVFKNWNCTGLELTEEQRTARVVYFTMPDHDVNLKAEFVTPTKPDPAPENYKLIVSYAKVTLKDGSAVADLKAVPMGTELKATADEDTETSVFKNWNCTGLDLTEEQRTAHEIYFTMPDHDVELTAVFEVPATPDPKPDPNPTPNPDPTPAPGGDSDGGGAAIVAVAAVGGAAIGVGAYIAGTTAYLKSVLPEGMAIPANRQQLAVALWTAAGKPATQSTALFNDVAADAAELQAIRWVVDTGLMSAQDGSFKPGSRVGRMEVIRTWKTYQQRG